MMVFNKSLILRLIIIFGVSTMSCAKETKDCCIIFWDNNPDLSIEYLDNTDYMECIKRFPEYTKLDFSEIEKFDQDCQVFVLKREIEKTKYQRISREGQLYISIVIDNEIVFNGINGFIFSTSLPSMLPPKLDRTKQIIDISSKKYLIISDRMPWDVFEKRDTVDKELKTLICKEINQFIE